MTPSLPRFLLLFLALLLLRVVLPAADQAATGETRRLADFRMRDACVLADEASGLYYIVSADRDNGVRAFTSEDLVEWSGPHRIFETPEGFWGGAEMRGIWAPEMHLYEGRYYLFLTFNTDTELCEQWHNWRPRVRRGSQILVGDSPLGPFKPFADEPTLPKEWMTLDGTLYVEDGTPYMVYCHEWVQIVNGTVEYVELAPDLSRRVSDPTRLFYGNDAPWSERQPEGCWVTDGPSFHRSKSGKLFMIWSSFGAGGYTVGLAISDSGKLAGPWRQQAEPIFADNGGHGFLFHRFDGQLMMALHSPNMDTERIHLFEMEDTGETLRIARPFPATDE
ncbi:MAG: glycoside hydrolase family 43 protein [Verrucomicrobiota bacterium]